MGADRREPDTDQGSGSDTSPPPHWTGILGAVLMLAGGGLIVVKGLGVDVTVGDAKPARIIATLIGGLLLAWYVLGNPAGTEQIRRIIAGIVGGLTLAISLIVLFENPTMIDVVDFAEDNAVFALQQVGIDDVDVEYQDSDKPEGVVVSFAPAAGTRTAQASLVVSKYADHGPLPNVIGLDVGGAVGVLSSVGVEHEIVRVEGEPADQVADMAPRPGTASANVVLFVNDGTALPTVADVLGQERGAAVAMLEGEGIAVDVVEAESTDPEGTVIAQDPTPGVASATATLTVSAGPGLPVVPTFTALTYAQALANAEAADITLDRRDASSADTPSGVVIAQTPDAGTRADAVTVTVSTGPGLSDFAGDWLNVDEDTRGMTRLVIGEGTLHGYGSCSPTDCDWGETAASVVDGALVGTYDFGFKRSSITARISGPFLLVTEFNDYAAGDSRPDRTDSYVLALKPGDAFTASELSAIVVSPLYDELISAGIAEAVPAFAELAPLQLAPGG